MKNRNKSSQNMVCEMRERSDAMENSTGVAANKISKVIAEQRERP